MATGKFIIFEGNEGTGKSTHITFAANYLKKCNIDYIVTREPGGTSFGESIREILLNPDSSLDSISEAVLFYASRVYNYNNIILKALKEKGLIKIKNFQKNPNKIGYAYILTPKGVSQKTKLTINFMKRKMKEYDELKSEIEDAKK